MEKVGFGIWDKHPGTATLQQSIQKLIKPRNINFSKKKMNSISLEPVPLKELSSEMDPAESRLFRKIRPSRIEREPLKAMAPSRTVIAYYAYALNGPMRSKAHTALTAPLVYHHKRIYKRAMKKIIINDQMRNKAFLIVIVRTGRVFCLDQW
jgi:hypothetical protein